MKKTFLSLILATAASGVMAQNITTEMLNKFATENKLTGAEKAIHNALSAGSVTNIALNQDNQVEQDTYFSNSVPSKGITDQKSSGRCWLFTGMNVLRAKMINEQKLNSLELSQCYLFFYDQLEKANLFLQGAIDTRKSPADDRMVDWLFENPLSDGGTFCGVADLVNKYGVCPKEAMPETYSSNNTSQISMLL